MADFDGAGRIYKKEAMVVNPRILEGFDLQGAAALEHIEALMVSDDFDRRDVNMVRVDPIEPSRSFVSLGSASPKHGMALAWFPIPE